MPKRWKLGRFRRASDGLIVAVLACLALASCGGSGSSAGVPSLHHNNAAASSTDRNAQALHAAAQCLRDHGIPNYADPVIGPGQVVYTDQRTLENVGGAVVHAATRACRSLIGQANFDPSQRPHPPAQMVRDGVREAQCLRAHGLPNWPDPKATDSFDPGHGFQVSDEAFAGAVPAGANPKASSVFQHAIKACQTETKAEINDSQLSNLAHGQ